MEEKKNSGEKVVKGAAAVVGTVALVAGGIVGCGVVHLMGVRGPAGHLPLKAAEHEIKKLWKWADE
jgi:hypothetical protein